FLIPEECRKNLGVNTAPNPQKQCGTPRCATLFFLEGFYDLSDYIAALEQLLLGHDQWWCKPNDIAVGWLSKQTLFGKFHTDIPGKVPIFFIINDDGIEKAFTSDKTNNRIFISQFLHTLSEYFTQAQCIGIKALIFDNFKCSLRYDTSQWIAAKS